MPARNAYQTQNLVNWTRIDMLLALYDRAIEHCRAYCDNADQAARELHRVRAIRIVMHLRLGLNLELGEVPQRVAQLLEFVHHCLLNGGAASVGDGCKILTTLREGFGGIQEEAIELERRGEIPPVDEWKSVERLA